MGGTGRTGRIGRIGRIDGMPDGVGDVLF